MEENKKFRLEQCSRIASYKDDINFHKLSDLWLEESMRKEYVYNFSWMGRPIIQSPVDMIAMQEVIWTVQPDLVIETGVAHGGSLLYYASLLELNAIAGGHQKFQVLGIDIDIREHNKKAIQNHPISRNISLFQGSSIAQETIDFVTGFSADYKNILLLLDSNHTHQHVLAEMEAYAPLVTPGSYCVVFDTHVEHFTYAARAWGKGNSPLSAINEFIKTHTEFIVDEMIDAKLMISTAPQGYLKRIA